MKTKDDVSGKDLLCIEDNELMTQVFKLQV